MSSDLDSGYENGARVPVCDLDGSAEELDGINDFTNLRDQDYPPEVLGLARGYAFAMAVDMVRRLMLYVVDDPKPDLAADIIGSVFGLRLRAGISDSQLAVRYGITKQAFEQRKDRFLHGLQIKRVIVRGCKLNASHYRDTNYRGHKRSLITAD